VPRARGAGAPAQQTPSISEPKRPSSAVRRNSRRSASGSPKRAEPRRDRDHPGRRGIGKTRLIDALVRQVSDDVARSSWVAVMKASRSYRSAL